MTINLGWFLLGVVIANSMLLGWVAWRIDDLFGQLKWIIQNDQAHGQQPRDAAGSNKKEKGKDNEH